MPKNEAAYSRTCNCTQTKQIKEASTLIPRGWGFFVAFFRRRNGERIVQRLWFCTVWGNVLLLHGVEIPDLIFLTRYARMELLPKFGERFSSLMTNTWHRVLLCQPDRGTGPQVMGCFILSYHPFWMAWPGNVLCYVNPVFSIFGRK